MTSEEGRPATQADRAAWPGKGAGGEARGGQGPESWQKVLMGWTGT